MKTFFFSFLLCCLFLQNSRGQTLVTGLVLDKTQQPIENVNIYLADSKIGTKTDAKGGFQLKNLPIGNYEIIVSHVSYEVVSQKLELKIANQSVHFSFTLTEKLEELSSVGVQAKVDKKWKRQLKQFKVAFFGTSANARKCKILNPWVIDFEQEENAFIAKASEAIQIENRATGYKIYFFLSLFKKENREVTYAGKPFFEELTPKDPKEQQLWIRNRIITYSGSKRHFLKALADNNLKEEGFEINRAKKDGLHHSMIILGALREKNIVQPRANNQYVFYFNDFLQVVYTKENKPINYQASGGYVSGGDVIQQFGKAAGEGSFKQGSHKDEADEIDKFQKSYLFARTRIILLADGNMKNPQDLKEYGYWAWERIAELLPLTIEFKEEKQNSEITENTTVGIKKDIPLSASSASQKIPQKNGFILSDLLIPLHEILEGGASKDGIPAINKPMFIAQEKVTHIADDDFILGVEYNGISKAYPIKIMNWHELVNDDFGGVPLLVSYCPLCGSGMAFLSEVNGKKKTFGVSGLLYNSDVLFYDKETQSLWSQILGKSVAGKSSGATLTYVNVSLTKWKKWKNTHLTSLALSTQTGFQRDYTKSPYEQYEASDNLMFPVSKSSKILSKKERVLGIEINRKFKAYPFSRLKKAKGKKIADTFEGKHFVISYDVKNEVAEIHYKNGKRAPSVTLYWFAWFAFHPETKVYK